MKTIKWNSTYFGTTHGYLSYSFMMEESLCYSGMGWTHEQIKLLESLLGESYVQLMSGESIEITNEAMSSIHSIWSDARYKKYHKVYIPREADMDIVKTIYEAWKNDSAIMIEFKEGYEMYPSEEEENDGAVVSDNGLIHVAYVGKSTGTKPVLLHLASGRSHGGGEFMFTGIKSVKMVDLRCAA
jgi:hypothetical protein